MIDETLWTITSLIFQISLKTSHLCGVHVFMKHEGYPISCYEPQILKEIEVFFVNKYRFLFHPWSTDHSLVQVCPLHYADDVAACFGSTICGTGVLFACEYTAENYIVAV